MIQSNGQDCSNCWPISYCKSITEGLSIVLIVEPQTQTVHSKFIEGNALLLIHIVHLKLLHATLIRVAWAVMVLTNWHFLQTHAKVNLLKHKSTYPIMEPLPYYFKSSACIQVMVVIMWIFIPRSLQISTKRSNRVDDVPLTYIASCIFCYGKGWRMDTQQSHKTWEVCGFYVIILLNWSNNRGFVLQG